MPSRRVWRLACCVKISPEPDRHSRARQHSTPIAYRTCEGIIEVLLYFTVVFNPWAFGTTQSWSVGVMNITGYSLGLLLLFKWLICWRTGYRPSRWRPLGSLDFTAAILTVVVLAYCLISAVNARMTFMTYPLLDYRECIRWLPHSYCAPWTWRAFGEYLGLALTFWAMRDWLLGKTHEEQKSQPSPAEAWKALALPARLRRLLWILCANGLLLAIEGIVQRLAGSNRLLWLIQPMVNQTAESQFGPYAYRSTAAQYFNLVWPVCAGFAWLWARAARQARHAGGLVRNRYGAWLVPAAILMAACPVISTSRGGALVAAGMIPLVLLGLLFANHRGHLGRKIGIILLFVLPVQLGLFLGWDQLKPRLERMFSDQLGGRTGIYKVGELIARDFPVFGTGPGSFSQIYSLYRTDDAPKTIAQAHNDWLETRVDMGWLGLGLVLLLLAVVALNWFYGEGIPAPAPWVAMIWIALAGCLVHARFDMPFRAHSVLSLFLTLCCILLCVHKKGASSKAP